MSPNQTPKQRMPWITSWGQAVQVASAFATLLALLTTLMVSWFGKDQLVQFAKSKWWIPSGAIGLMAFVLIWRAHWLFPDEFESRTPGAILRRVPGALLRACIRTLTNWFIWIVLVLAPVLVVRSVAIGWVHARPDFPTWSANMVYFWANLCTLVALLLLSWCVIGFARALRAHDPAKALGEEILHCVAGYAGNLTGGERASISTLWKSILLEDGGAVFIQAVNARELFEAGVEGVSPIEAAVRRDPARHIRLLIADPTTVHVRIHDLLLYGRFRDYYAKNLVMVFERLRALRTEFPSAKVEIRFYDRFPVYRMIGSPIRTCVQRYSPLQAAYQQKPYLVHNVLHCTTVRGVQCTVNGATASPPSCALDGLRSGRLQSSPSIYSHFLQAFEVLWNERQSSSIESLESWSPVKMKRLLRLAGVPKDRVRKCGENSNALAAELRAFLAEGRTTSKPSSVH